MPKSLIDLPAERPPEKRLPLKPAIKNKVDLDKATAELSWLVSREETIKAATKQKAELVKAEAERLMCVTIGRTEVSFADRIQALREAIEAYCEEHRQELLDGKKSVELTYAVVGWRQSAESLTYQEGETAQSVVALLDEALSLTSKLQGVLQKLKYHGVPAETFVDVKPTINKSRIKDAVDRGVVSDELLSELGLERKPAEDKFYCKPQQYTLVQQPAA